MLNFKRDFFFVKFSILFFLIVLFGYWGIDLNSEEVYIAFSFFFLVILAFVGLRLGVLSFFSGLVNKRYAYVVREGIVAVYIAKIVGVLWQSPLKLISFVNRNYYFFVITVMTVFESRAQLLLNYSRLRFSFLKIILSVSANFFAVSIYNFCKNYSFSGSLSKLFSIEV